MTLAPAAKQHADDARSGLTSPDASMEAFLGHLSLTVILFSLLFSKTFGLCCAFSYLVRLAVRSQNHLFFCGANNTYAASVSNLSVQ